MSSSFSMVLNRARKHLEIWSPENIRELEEAIFSLGSMCSYYERRFGSTVPRSREAEITDRSLFIPYGQLLLGESTSLTSQLANYGVGSGDLFLFSAAKPHSLMTGLTTALSTPYPDGFKLLKEMLPPISFTSNPPSKLPMTGGEFTHTWNDRKNRPVFVAPPFDWGNNPFAASHPPKFTVKDTFPTAFKFPYELRSGEDIYNTIGEMGDPIPYPAIQEHNIAHKYIGKKVGPAYSMPLEYFEKLTFTLGEGNDPNFSIIDGFIPSSILCDALSVKFDQPISL